MKKGKDKALEYLLDLDGEHYMIDAVLGFWVKFEVKEVSEEHRTNGIRYSLSLHDQWNKRIMGFDNAHAIEYDGKRYVKGKRTFDHCHFDEADKGQPYFYENAAKLIQDFWKEVDKIINRHRRLN